MRRLSKHAIESLSAAVVAEADGATSLPEAYAAELEAAKKHANRKLGRYFLLAEVGRGSGGCVFRAYDPVLKRLAAVKRISTEGMDATTLERLEQEFIAMASISHPGVVSVFDAGLEQNNLYFAMEWMEDGNLEDRQKREPLSSAKAVSLIHGLAEALSATHAAGILHLDIKPANILISGEQVKISDFGAVQRLLPTEAAGRRQIGTLGFMAPEQAHGHRSAIDHRSDIFGLAATLKSLLPEKETQRLRLHSVLETAMAEDPAKRYSTMEEFGQALSSLERKPAPRWMTIATLVIVFGVTAWSLWTPEQSIATLLEQGLYDQALLQLRESSPEQPQEDPVWQEQLVSAQTGIWLKQFSFHPADYEESLRLELQRGLVETLPMELACLEILQVIAEGDGEPRMEDLIYLAQAFPKRAEPWLLQMSHSLHFEEEDRIDFLRMHAPEVSQHAAIEGLLALGALSSAPPQEALQALKLAAEDQGILWTDVGLLLLTEGNPKDAISAFQRCLAQHPSLATARHHLAVAQMRVGDTRGAIDTLFAWFQDVEAQEDLDWDTDPSEQLSLLARSSAVYVWPSKALLLTDPWLSEIWASPQAARLKELLEN